jgi:alkanesulfonate monooxygenase SsuD/methylene tetrahydromethanopterin reductase-like flavin-dependent oxidoreductase (luciferase family)
MKVSLAGAVRASLENPKSFPQIYDEFIELALLAEESGFHRVWLSEHHLAEDGWNPGCMLTLAALSRLTTRVRLGSFVLLIPLYHPLKVAEEIAMLDILSNGRFDLAIGARAALPECAAFGIEHKEAFGRSYEALHVIQRFLTEESVTHHGKHFHFDNVNMTTKPVQKPHPPIFTTPLYGPQSAEKSAERGYNIASALHSPYYKDYGAMLAKHGRRREDVQIATGPVFVHVSDSREQAFDEAERAMHWAINFYVRRGLPRPLAPIGEFRRPENAFAFGVPIIAGSPTDVLEGLSKFRNDNIDDLSLQFGHPGMDQKYALRSMRLFAKEVLPEVSRWS